MPPTRVVAGAVGALAVLLIVAVWLIRDSSKPVATPRVMTEQGTVLLIPGYGGGTGQLQSLRDALAADRIDAEIVDVGDGTGDLQGYADQVVARADELKGRGEPPPDVIGYSAGGVTARLAAAEHPASFRKVVTLAAPHAGTSTAELGALFGDCPAACQQLRPDSDLLTSIPEVQQEQSWLSVWSASDEVIRPAESSVLEGATNYRIQDHCELQVQHGEVPVATQSQAAVLAFLSGDSLPEACARA